MSAGTSLPTAKAALTTLLQARSGLYGVAISDNGPTSMTELQNDSGEFEAIWFGDARTDEVTIPYSGTPVTYDETYDVDLVLQVLKFGDDADTQTEADSRAAALLGEIVGAIALTPDLGVDATETLITFDAVLHGWEHTGGWLGKGDGNGCRFVVKVRVKARLQLT